MVVPTEAGYAGKTVLIVGAARSGIAAAAFLLEQEARVVLTDQKDEKALGSPLAALKERWSGSGRFVLQAGGHNPGSFRSCDFIVVSPGVPLTLPLFEESRKAGIPLLAEVELAARHLKGMILGITGSNGKTTTTVLVAELLRGAGLKGRAAGNIGTPLISFVPGSTPEDIYATELSSFQLECIHDFHPRVGALLNLTPDHMDRYRSFADYADAKMRLFMNQTSEDFAVLNADDALTAAAATRSAPVFFSRRVEPAVGTFIRDGRIFFRSGKSEEALFAEREIRLKGAHNRENVLAACAVALLAGASPAALGGVVRDFNGVEHRLEWVAEVREVEYFNDSKATNVDAAIKSLEAFPGGILLIAGGRDKGGDFTSLRSLVQDKVSHLIVLGEAAGKISEALGGAAEISSAASLPEAVEMAASRARPGDVVLLAPACASFDMFENYEHRGRVFKEAVRDLKVKSESHGL